MTQETVLLVIAIVAGLYMAWNVGANDVANAFGTAVGSGALTLKRAILLAAIFEFAGAFLVGQPVAKTISGGMIHLGEFQRLRDALGEGMVASLLAASIWLNIATHFGQPVSTTHAIIGAVIGFAVVACGPGCVSWAKMGKIALSWVISPFFGAVLAYLIYRLWVRKYILASRHPVYRTIVSLPVAMGALVAIVTLSIVYKGLPGLRLDFPLARAVVVSVSAGVAVWLFARLWLGRRLPRHGVRLAERYQKVEQWFGYMQISTACYMSFAHGANDVANAIGPLASAVRIFTVGRETAVEQVAIPPWLLALGGVGIVLGLSTYGYKVIEAVGKKITEITPTRGFSAEFGTATSVLVFSKLGMPISTTFVVVGAVMGVGFARGFGAIDLKVIRRIFASWLITIPFSAVMSAAIFWIIDKLVRG